MARESEHLYGLSKVIMIIIITIYSIFGLLMTPGNTNAYVTINLCKWLRVICAVA